jgi:hypothetical protein
LGRDKWGLITESTLAKAIRVLSTVMTWIKDEGDTKANDEESGDIWCEASESKTHSKYDILEELWGNWHIKEEVDIACRCKERNFWNCSARVLELVKGPDKTIDALLWYDGL